MKAKLLFVCFTLVCSTGLFAQKTTTAPQAANTNPSLGHLIVQLTNHISPTYLNPDFAKNLKGWQYKAERSKNMISLGWFVQSLESGLSSTAYTDNWLLVRDRWISDSKAINTVKQAASLIKTLEENIQKNAFDKTWNKDKKDWESALNNVTQ